MREVFFQLSEEKRAELASLFTTEVMKSFTANTKAASDDDTGTFRVIISTDSVDRQGEIVNQDGLDFKNYMKNPVVLWAHDYYSAPVGMCLSIEREGNQTIATGKFAPADANPFAQQVRKLYDLGFMRAVSIGFIPTEMDGKGNALKAEVLEFSFVPVPANAEALSLDDIKKNNLNLNLIYQKGINVNIKGAEEGAACQMDDGTPGTLGKDPNDPNSLICLPTENASAKATDPDHDGDDDSSNGPDDDDALDFLQNVIEGEQKKHIDGLNKSIDMFTEKMLDNSDEGEQAKAIDEFKDMADDEHDRHDKRIKKAIDEFTEKSMSKKAATDDEGEDDEDEGKIKPSDPKTLVKAMKMECSMHRDYVMKAIDDFTEKAMGCSEEEMNTYTKGMKKSVKTEHGRHTDAVNKAIDEFTEKSETPADTTDEKRMKSGRAISSKNRDVLQKAMDEMAKAIDIHKSIAEMHGDLADHMKTVHAALKDTLAKKPADDEGDETDDDSGSDEDPEQKSDKTAKGRETSGVSDTVELSVEEFLQIRKLQKTLATALGESLSRSNEAAKSIAKSGKK